MRDKAVRIDSKMSTIRIAFAILWIVFEFFSFAKQRKEFEMEKKRA